jgi:uncharacterized protein YjbI with pentapeptide repeats
LPAAKSGGFTNLFDGAILRNTVIRGGSFEEASFANADLTGASGTMTQAQGGMSLAIRLVLMVV